MSIKAILVGAGGFGRELLDVVEAHNASQCLDKTDYIHVLGIVDDSPKPSQLNRLLERGYAHLGGIDYLLEQKTKGYYLLGIGDPRVRHRIAERVENGGWQPLTVIHPTANISSSSEIGPGSVLCGGVQLSADTRLGRHVHLNPNSTVGHDTVLDDYVSVNPGAIVSGEVNIRRRTLVGAGAVILQRLSIGEDVLIGASSCVTRSVTDATIVVGVPARFMAPNYPALTQ